MNGDEQRDGRETSGRETVDAGPRAAPAGAPADAPVADGAPAASAGGRLQVDVVTLFPQLLSGAFEHSILARAAARGLVSVTVHDLREHAEGPHRQADDAPFGGGSGMVLKPEPFFRAVEAITGRPAGEPAPGEAIVLLSPSGRRHDQRNAARLARLRRIVLLCGRYEGVDERVRDVLATETLSVGDFVLSGGEPAAACVVDSVVRLIPGALGNAESTRVESHAGDGLLEAPHWTRPASYRGHDVPEVLLSGHHERIERWRRDESLRLSARCRPDLVEAARRAGRLGIADERVLARRADEDGRDGETTTDHADVTAHAGVESR